MSPADDPGGFVNVEQRFQGGILPAAFIQGAMGFVFPGLGDRLGDAISDKHEWQDVSGGCGYTRTDQAFIYVEIVTRKAAAWISTAQVCGNHTSQNGGKAPSGHQR